MEIIHGYHDYLPTYLSNDRLAAIPTAISIYSCLPVLVQDLPAGAPPAVTVEVSMEDVTLIEEEAPARAPRPLQLQHHHQPWAPLPLQLQRHRP